VSADQWWTFAILFYWNDPTILLYLIGIPFLFYRRRRSPRAALLGIGSLAGMFIVNTGFTVFLLFFYRGFGEVLLGYDPEDVIPVANSEFFSLRYQLAATELVNKLLLGVLVVAVLIDRSHPTTKDA
jgi:hypothetical protein